MLCFSELSKEATEIENGELYFPLWNDVFGKIYFSHRQLVERGFPRNKDDLRMLKDARNYGEFCREKLFGSWKAGTTVHPCKRHLKGGKGLNLQKQEDYGKLFDELLHEKENTEKSPTSFPLLSCSTTTTPTPKKGLRLIDMQRFYQRQKENKETVGPSRNKYSLYKISLRDTYCLNYWQDLQLPKSLKQLVEVCSKLIFLEPALLAFQMRKFENEFFNIWA